MYRKLSVDLPSISCCSATFPLSNVGVSVRNLPKRNLKPQSKTIKKMPKETNSFTLIKRSQYLVVNSESYVDRSSRRASRAAWKQSQCVASGQAGGGGGGFGSASASPIPPVGQQPAPAPTTAATSAAATSASAGPSGIILPVGGDGVLGVGGGAYLPFGNQQSINNLLTTRSASALSHSQQSTVSISSGSVSSIPSSLATSGPTAPSIGGLSGLGGARPIATSRHTLPKL